MEELEAVPATPPPRGPGRPKYPPAHREAMLKALAAWKGSRKAFCLEHKVHSVTLWEWEKAAKGGKTPKPAKKAAKAAAPFTPEQKRKAVEAFTKSGQTLLNFGKAWGINAQVLGRWVRAYRQHGPKALEGRAGRKKGRQPVAEGLREGIKQVKEQFPDFGIRKVSAFLARFKGLKASPPQIRRVVEEEQLPKGKLRQPPLNVRHLSGTDFLTNRRGIGLVLEPDIDDAPTSVSQANTVASQIDHLLVHTQNIANRFLIESFVLSGHLRSIPFYKRFSCVHASPVF